VTKGWKEELEVFGKYENVYCKITGLVTKGDWNKLKRRGFFILYFLTLDIFGTERVMYGSDRAVCLPSASYSQVC
jgi:L-fuconolactonase